MSSLLNCLQFGKDLKWMHGQKSALAVGDIIGYYVTSTFFQVRYIVHGSKAGGTYEFRVINRQTNELSKELYRGRAYNNAWRLSDELSSKVKEKIK